MSSTWTITLTVQFYQAPTPDELRTTFEVFVAMVERQYAEGITEGDTDQFIEQIFVEAETGEKELIPS